MRIVLILMFGLSMAAAPLFTAQADDKVADDAVVADVPQIEGKDMFSARCALCHQLPEPDMLKAKQWGLIIETMQQRMQQAKMPQLNEQEKKILLEFLAQHARQ